MNKDFETEYREYQKLSTPDLWDRIEAGIDAVEAEPKEESKKIVKFPVWKMATIAAACFAVIICIPALGILGLVSVGSKSTADVVTNEMASVETETAYEEEYADTEAVYESETVETTTAADMSDDFLDFQSETSEEAVAGDMSEDGTTEVVILNVSISQVDILDNEIKYTTINLDTQETIIIIHASDSSIMKEGFEYTISAIKAEEDIYYLVDLMVE